jgi:hypothetical protein
MACRSQLQPSDQARAVLGGQNVVKKSAKPLNDIGVIVTFTIPWSAIAYFFEVEYCRSLGRDFKRAEGFHQHVME